MDEPNPAPAPKPHIGPPFGSKNAQKHGLYASDARRVDMRRREDKDVNAALTAIENDLADLSAQKRVILDGVGRKLRDLFKLENYLEGLSSIVNKRKRCLIPAVVEKHRILESIARDLQVLGLERRAREISIHEYMASRPTESSSAADNGKEECHVGRSLHTQENTENTGNTSPSSSKRPHNHSTISGGGCSHSVAEAETPVGTPGTDSGGAEDKTP